jgi:hypothetical protein
MISFKPLDSYYSDDDRAVVARTAQLVAARDRRQTELADIDIAIAKHDVDPTPDDQIENLIAGIDVPPPQPLSAKRTALQHVIRDINEALDFMKGKGREVTIKAGVRLAKDIKPQHDIAAKELAAALVVVHEKHQIYWAAKRHLVNTGVGLHGLFDSNIDEILGIPVDKGTRLADVFRAAVAAGHLKAMPVELR